MKRKEGQITESFADTKWGRTPIIVRSVEPSIVLEDVSNDIEPVVNKRGRVYDSKPVSDIPMEEPADFEGKPFDDTFSKGYSGRGNNYYEPSYRDYFDNRPWRSKRAEAKKRSYEWYKKSKLLDSYKSYYSSNKDFNKNQRKRQFRKDLAGRKISKFINKYVVEPTLVLPVKGSGNSAYRFKIPSKKLTAYGSYKLYDKFAKRLEDKSKHTNLTDFEYGNLNKHYKIRDEALKFLLAPGKYAEEELKRQIDQTNAELAVIDRKIAYKEKLEAEQRFKEGTFWNTQGDVISYDEMIARRERNKREHRNRK